jgi:hypothetical protein
MISPDTGLEKTARVAATTRLWWAADARVPVSGSLEVAPVVAFRVPTGTVSANLAPQFTSAAIAAAPSRDTLTLGASSTGAQATFALGEAHIISPAMGAIPVRVASISGTAVQLVERLPYALPDAASCTLQSALWYTDVGAGSPVATETRTSTITDLPVPYTVTWTYANPAGSSVVVVDEGILNVVRQPFETGLTTAQVRARWPELGSMQGVGSVGFEAIILRTLEALRLRVRASVREAMTPGYGWETDINGAPFLPFHAAEVAASCLDSVAPDRAAAIREQSVRLFTDAMQTAWLDKNRDGVVDLGETPALIGGATAATIAPSYVPTPVTGWGLGERR